MEAQSISISLRDESNGYAISPDRVPMNVLRTFTKDVEEFLRGEGSEVDASSIEVQVFNGSLGFLTAPMHNAPLLKDLRLLSSSEMLDGLDAKRREVIERWQKLAKGARQVVFKLTAPSLSQPVTISASTDFHSDDADQWVKVERYMQGEVEEMGGHRKANVHIRLQNGTLLIVESNKDVFRNDKVNRLYKQAMARISAEYNVVTRKYRNARLLAFEEHQHEPDEVQMQRLIERGTKAWNDVPNANQWVEALRGGEA